MRHEVTTHVLKMMKDLRKEEKTKCRDAMYKSMGVFKYLVKEFLKFTGPQIQFSYLICIFSI